MTRLTNNQLLTLTKKLIAIESTTQHPKGLREAYALIVRMLQECGKDIAIEHFESDGKPSLLAYRGKHRPDNFRIILNGHVDVVPGTPELFKPFVKDGRLYGRGSYDMKGAAVILTDAFCEFVDQVPYALGLQIVTDEELGGAHGTEYQVSHGVRGDFIICGECGRHEGTHEIANAAKGITIAEIGFSGTSAHGAYPWKGENAVIAATRFVQEVHERYPIPEEETFDTTITVTALHTENKVINIVPDSAIVRLDARFSAGDPNFRTKQHFAALIEEIDPNATINSIAQFWPPAYCSPRNPLLLALKASAEKVEGAPFNLATRHGGSEGRFYANVGDQACEFGIPGEHQHAEGEYITIVAFNNYRATMHDFLANTIESEKDNANTRAYNG